MKFRLTMKDPDGVSDSVDECVRKSMQGRDGLSERELAALEDIRRQETNDFVARWIEYGEYVTIEFDTDAGTAKVVER